MDKYIASPAARALALFFGVLFVVFIVIGQVADLSNRNVLYLSTVIFGLLALLGCIHSFHGVYRAWMNFAALLQKGISTILFGACYLFMVPFIVVFVRISDPLKLKASASKQDTFWIQRHADEKNVASYQRMG